MTEHTELEMVESTAFDENLEEIIYHLDLEPNAKEILELLDVDGLEDVCAMCGERAVWYTSEIQAEAGFDSDEGRITRCWCDECISGPFIELWKTWPWTPDEKLENYTDPIPSDSHCVDGGLATQQNNPEVVSHLDLQNNSSDVTGILKQYGIAWDEAVCHDCGQQAVWYYAEIYDVSRAYDFEAARENELLCDDCIDPGLVDLWARWPWTPDGDYEKETCE
ncbi:hypothetical protein M0R89_15215 [Halorussus limi]|uniref:Uncharacterized protein n=2 Tax=Halorussus TaxID=1070314 RepID=A0A8U0IG98_9EURY|nr:MULTISPECIES: hypothetical protein [Halorussus]UPV73880.1 hypothetical protein M0R89_15215 [Halorussus limi]UPV99897.1 hypothetical protein M0R88_15430 [Halorussus gelatinilyticus]